MIPNVTSAGQPCDLVLAGLHVKGSSSKKAEEELGSRHLDLRGRIHAVGHVTSASRAWLLANAEVVLYPSSAQGVGCVSYEAAALGTEVAGKVMGLHGRAVRRFNRRRGQMQWRSAGHADAHSADDQRVRANAAGRVGLERAGGVGSPAGVWNGRGTEMFLRRPERVRGWAWRAG